MPAVKDRPTVVIPPLAEPEAREEFAQVADVARELLRLTSDPDATSSDVFRAADKAYDLAYELDRPQTSC